VSVLVGQKVLQAFEQERKRAFDGQPKIAFLSGQCSYVLSDNTGSVKFSSTRLR